MMRWLPLWWISLAGLWYACKPATTSLTAQPRDEPVGTATGDSVALSLAHRTLDASGGREAWHALHYLTFTYLDNRTWYFDKYLDRYRVEFAKTGMRITGHFDGTETHAWVNGRPVTNTDSTSLYADLASKVWKNDILWLAFPFELLHPGNQLSYLGKANVAGVTDAETIEVTKENPDPTDLSKYRLFFDPDTHLICFWEFYERTTDTIPFFSHPWTGYHDYGKLKLASWRGNKLIGNIATPETWPEALFTTIQKPAEEILGSAH